MQHLEYYDLIRLAILAMSIFNMSKLLSSRKALFFVATDRLKNMYWGMLGSMAVFLVGVTEQILRDRPGTYTLYLILLVVGFTTTGLLMGKPLELMKDQDREIDPGYKSGYAEGYRKSRRGRDAGTR